MTTYPVPAKKILVIQLRQVGDVLLTTPAVKTIRAHYADSSIWYVTETGPAVLLQGNPHIDHLLTRRRRDGIWQDIQLVRRLRQEKFDLVIDFFCNPRSAWVSFLTGAPHRIAVYHGGRAWWYTETPKIETGKGYAAEDKLALLQAIGLQGKLVPPVIHVSDEANLYIEEFFRRINRSKRDHSGLLVTIDPTSRRQAKRWIPERYVHLADRLVERYQAMVIFIWGPGEHDMAASLVKQGKYQHLLACPTNLMQLAALIAKSDMHIGNCSAPRHIAAAVGTPSVTVMGPTSPENWTYPSPIHQVVRGDVSCLECQKTTCDTHECMNRLTVQEVEACVERVLMTITKEMEQNSLRSLAPLPAIRLQDAGDPMI